MRRLLLVTIFALASCATYHDELMRGEQDYEKNDHERALAVFRALDANQSHFDVTEEARYAYLRGMTDYRIGYRADARHWLAIAKAVDDENKDALPADWKSRLVAALNELNAQVFSGGMAALGDDGKKTRTEPIKPAKPSDDE
jgi:hypothetical protein